VLAGWYVSADGTGVPMVSQELKGRRGKQADGTAKTRQVYLGCVFTQHRTDEKAIRCGIMNPRPMFPVSSPLMLSARYCARRRFGAAWAALAK